MNGKELLADGIVQIAGQPSAFLQHRFFCSLLLLNNLLLAELLSSCIFFSMASIMLLNS